MEQPRHREAAAAAEGGDGSGGSLEEPGVTGGRRGWDSAGWNGSCGWAAAAGREEEEEEEDGDGDGEHDPGPERCCRCRGEPASAPSAAAEEEDEEEDAGLQRPGRRQRAAVKKEEGSRREGKRPQPPRRRSRGAEAAAGWREPLLQARRLAAEAGGRLLCSCCRLGAAEPGSVWGWGRAVGQRARSGSLRAARCLRAAARLGLRLLWMLLALLLLLLMLLLGCLRLCGRAGAAAVQCAAGSRLLDVAALRRTWGLLWVWLRPCRDPPWAGAAGGTGVAAPEDRGEEVTRLLAMAEMPEEELNPFHVLGVEATASDTELRRAYRRLAVLVHPDKNEHPRAEAAFKVLRAAWDVVSSPERRREFEMNWMAQHELPRSVGEFLRRLQEELREAMNTMMCSKCQGKHRRFEMNRDPLSARYCAECGHLHAAEEGDLWAESSLLGLKITYFAMMDGKIYDITEWAGCQRVGISPDTHRVPYHLSFGPRGAGRHRSTPKGNTPSAGDLQDFFTRIFQSSSGPGGPFPPPPNPPAAAAPPRSTPKAEGAAPKGDMRHKRRKKLRRPLQR
ncbi:dnaJ homolog subfamily C member 14 [Neopsephotus bourkii]|uniref:dnaJ homolog subfamily C member 14 n=1 Tax=Neopsephotus bourkii TaxID=309878 RepID=UPI002AA59A2B|nr:dnaJ homolog subfamily C member 14 [Neopsephotus bourkii]